MTEEEEEFIALALTDALTPYGRDFDPEAGGRLLRARMETLLRRTRRAAWREGWQHYSENPFPQVEGFGVNPYDDAT